MPAETPRRQEIVAAALLLLESQGLDGVTMRAVAGQLGIQGPSLYKHLSGKRELEIALISEGFRDSAEHLRAAVAGSRQPLRDVAAAYRAWALRRPHLYRLMTDGPLPRDELDDGVEAAAGAPLVSAAGGDPDLARAAWALMHGLTVLEISQRFPPDADLDAAWNAGITALQPKKRQRTTTSTGRTR